MSKEIVTWINQHKTSLALAALPFLAGVSVAYDTLTGSSVGPGLDSFFNPGKVEAGVQALNPIIDLTAPTYKPETINAHIDPNDIIITSPVYVTNTRLIGIFVGFSDQTQGIADLQSGKYQNAYLNNAQVVPDFFSHFTSISVTLETRDPIIMDHPWADYNGNGGSPDPGEIIFQELLTRNKLSERYDGHTYPIYMIIDAKDPSTPPRMGGGGGKWTTSTGIFGYTLTQGDMLLMPGPYYNEDVVLTHESLHAIGLQHNTSPLSIMYSGWPNGNPPRRLDLFDIDKLRKPLSTPTPTPSPTPRPTPIPIPQHYEIHIPEILKNATN